MLCAAGEKEGIVTLNDDARIICTKSYGKFAATFISPQMIWKLRRISGNYDIVHVHHPDPMACLSLFLSNYKGKVVLHWHSDILKQKTLLKLYQPLQNWLIKRADMIVGTTPVYVQQSPCLQQVQHKIDYIPIGVEPIVPPRDRVQEIRASYKGKKIVFSLGRLVEYKGYEYLIEAAEYLNDDYVVLIGGGGPLRGKLQAKINNAGLSDRVKLLGFLPDEVLPQYFEACDLFCMSSIWKTEAFGIVQIEAMSCGKPVVATRIPESGVSWVNEDGVSGLNADPENGKSLAEAILKVTKNEETYNKFAKGAYDRYKSLFSYEQMIDNCMRIYSGLWKK
jgi:rhamnosyl/mannosyltransferase